MNYDRVWIVSRKPVASSTIWDYEISVKDFQSGKELKELISGGEVLVDATVARLKNTLSTLFRAHQGVL